MVYKLAAPFIRSCFLWIQKFDFSTTLEVPEEYEASISNENHGNLVITNSYTTGEPTETEEYDKPDETKKSESTDQSGESTGSGDSEETGKSLEDEKEESKEGPQADQRDLKKMEYPTQVSP